jgi:hypothetical protein
MESTSIRVNEIRERMKEGLAGGDTARDIWHDEHVDEDMRVLLDIIDKFIGDVKNNE